MSGASGKTPVGSSELNELNGQTREGPPVRLLMIDNYDSFTYNLVQYLGELGAQLEVVRNDAEDVADLLRRNPEGVVISPGPGVPGRRSLRRGGEGLRGSRDFRAGGVSGASVDRRGLWRPHRSS